MDKIIVNSASVQPQLMQALTVKLPRELGLTTVELAKRLRLAQPTMSQSPMRGRKIALDEGLTLVL